MVRKITTASAFLYVQPTTLPNVFRVDSEETLIDVAIKVVMVMKDMICKKRYRSEYTCMLIIERTSLGVICSEKVAKLTTI